MKKNMDPMTTPMLSTAQRRYLFFTAATTGAAIMIIEILGAKMLAPYVGTSHFVWTAQITVTLVALAAGYYAGGRWTDRSPGMPALYLAILLAASYLCGAVLLVERVACAALSLRLALGSLLASAFLFFVPLALLATTGPFLVQKLTSSLQHVGGSVGRLTAVSTLGSVAGTTLIGYVLIPLLPNSLTMLLTAGALILLAAGYFLVWGFRAGTACAALLALAIGLACGWSTMSKAWVSNSASTELYRGNSNFGQLQVLQSRQMPYRIFLNDYLVQGAYDTQTQKSIVAFTHLLHDLSRAYSTNLQDVLCIGLGVGIVPMQFAREGARVEVVEINPAVVSMAQQYFDFQPERMRITLGDGRQYVAACRQRYDVIILDAFLGETSPFHLMTREAFLAMRRILRPNGILVINAFGNFATGRDFQVASLQKTLEQVFPQVRLHADSPDAARAINVFLVASAGELAIRQQPVFDHIPAICRGQVESAFARIVTADTAHGIVLTDDYNPVDYYDAANREQMRRDLVALTRGL
ncbi:MAG: fused MFS/spermidine synthase [Kiritimatiellia bacterium]